ncbi:MAG: hypothetical protein JWL71_3800 [Acidobacteria bacterium]|nr:hypothetical protein [Acidobacteriota bacterium]
MTLQDLRTLRDYLVQASGLGRDMVKRIVVMRVASAVAVALRGAVEQTSVSPDVGSLFYATNTGDARPLRAPNVYHAHFLEGMPPRVAAGGQ